MTNRGIGLLLSLSLVVSLSSAANAAPGDMKYTKQGQPISKQQYDALVEFNKSHESFMRRDYATAEQLLRRSLELDPKCVEAHCNLGLVLVRQGRTEEAIAELKQALELDPARPEALLGLASTYQATGRLHDAIDLYDGFIAKQPNHQITPTVRSLAALLKEEYAKEEAVDSRVSADERRADYFPFTTYDAVTKWTSDKFPLKVYMPSEQQAETVPQYRPEFGQALHQAFEQWQQKSNGVIKFTFVPSPQGADIVCKWTANPAEVRRPSEGGEAQVQFDALHGNKHCDITILTKSIDGTGMELPLNMVRFACLHEVGHSLGMIGHSPDSHDIMFCSAPAEDKAFDLTTRDAATLVHLYQPDVKLSYTYHAPTGDTSKDKIALNNEGVSLSSQGDLAHAVEKFEAALRVDPSYGPSKRNLAACLNNMGIALAKEGKFADAEPRLKRAMELQADDENQKRAATMQNYAFVLMKLNRTEEGQAMLALSKKLSGK